MNKGHIGAIAVAIAGLFYIAIVRADSWIFPRELVEETFEFGSNQVIRIRDARENSTYPDYQVKVIASDGELLALYRNVSFTHFAISPKGDLFVGVSNFGLPGSAIFAIRADGGLEFEVKHHNGNIQYCGETITFIRGWYDGSNPEIDFAYHTEEDLGYANLDSIEINGCRGERLDILELL